MTAAQLQALIDYYEAALAAGAARLAHLRNDALLLVYAVQQGNDHQAQRRATQVMDRWMG